MFTSEIRIGVAGYGYWGPNLVRNLSSLAGCVVASICDPDSDRSALAAHIYPCASIGRDGLELAADPGIDAVVVATPVGSHYELARAALDSGKHVLVEKPLAPCSDEARELVDLARRRKVVLMVGHTFLYHGGIRKMRELVQEGELGGLLYIDSIRANLGILRDDVNVVWDLASHDLSILDYLIEAMPVLVSATGSSHTTRKLEDLAHIHLSYPDGLTAHIAVSWISPVKIRSMIVGGTRRMAVYDDCEPVAKIRIFDRGLARDLDPERCHNDAIRIGDACPQVPELDLVEPLQLEVADFVGAILEGRSPLADGESGLRLVQLLECIDRSMQRHGGPVGFAVQDLAGG